MRWMLTVLSLLIVFGTSVFAQGGTLRLEKGVVKLLREGRSQFLSSVGEKYRLQRGDRLHTGPDTRAIVAVRGESEVIELFSNAFLHFKGVTTSQTKIALLTGKGNFKVAPAPEATEERQAALKSLRPQAGGPQKFGLKERMGTSQKSGDQPGVGKALRLPESLAAQEARKDEQEEDFWAKIGSGAKQPGPRKRMARFQVRTVSAIVAVRGTDFVVATMGDVTNVFTVEGEVGVAAADLPDHEVTVPANTVSRVQGGFAPTQPEKVGAAERAQILESEGTEGFEDVEFGSLETTEAIAEQRRTGADDTAALLNETGADDLLDLLEEVVSETPTAPPATLETNIQLQLNFQ